MPGNELGIAVVLALAVPFAAVVVLIILWRLGKLDRAFPAGHCKRCGERIPDPNVEACPKCGHAMNRCQNCGYNLVGNTSGVCPECGVHLES